MARRRDDLDVSTSAAATAASPTPAAPVPGKRTLTEGIPLRPDLRTRFESSLGADLSAVRVHTGADSAASAADLGALAYTVGNQIHFDNGRYAPDDAFGVHLLAHEVAHTQQQAGAAPQTQAKLETTTPGDAAEVDADRAADAMIAGHAFTVARAPAAIARKTNGDEPAPESVRGGDTPKGQIDALKKQLVEDRAKARTIVLTLGPDEVDLDTQIATATGAEKTALEAKKAELAPRLAAARATFAQADADLTVLDRGPAVTDKDVNDVLARRGVTAAAPPGLTSSNGETASNTSVASDMSIDHKTSTSDNARTADGGSQTTTSSSSTNVGLTGATQTDSKSTATINGDTTSTSTDTTKRGVDLSKGQYTSSKTTSDAVTQGDKTTSYSQTKSGTLGPDGATLGTSKTEEKDGTKKTNDSSTGITRSGGDLGINHGESTSTTKADGSGSSSSANFGGGVVDGPNGVGAFAKGDASASKTSAKGLEVHGKTTGDGRVLINVIPVPDQPGKYQVQIAISLGVSVSAGGGYKKGDTNASLTGSASGSITAAYTHTLDEGATKAYLDAVDAAAKGQGGGRTELDLIKTGMTVGWDKAREMYEGKKGLDPAENLDDGDGISLDAKGDVGADVSGGTKSGSTGAGLSGGYHRSHEIQGGLQRVGDKIVANFLITDGSAISGGAKANEGVAGMSVDGKITSSTGKGYTFTVPDSYPNAKGLVNELEHILTVAQLDAFATAHPDLVGSKTTTESDGKSLSVGESVGPVGANVNVGHGEEHAHTDKLDDKGDVIEKDDAFDGHSNVGGGYNLGPLSHTDNSEEHIAVNVTNKKQKDGTWKQSATADVSQTDTSTGTDVLNTLDSAGDTIKKDPGGVLTGKTSLVKTETKKAVAGVLLSDGDIERIMSMAKNDQHKWINSGVSDRDEWEKCRRAIVAAGDDKEKVAKALADFGADGDIHNKETIEELIGANKGEGGDRYEFPDGLGDLKAQYIALVVNDPSGDVKEPAQADALAQKCDLFVSRMQQVQRESQPFKNIAIFDEMCRRAADRKAQLKRMNLELTAKATGKPIDAGALDRDTAIDRWNQLLDECRANTQNQEQYFSKISEDPNDLDAMQKINQLRELAPTWQEAYNEMCTLSDQYGLGADNKQWRSYKPDRTRLDIAYKGHDPNSDEAKDKSNEADLQADMNRTALADQEQQMQRNMDAQAMQYLPHDDSAQIASMQARVEGELAKTGERRGAAQQAAGKCNLLTSKPGGWDNVAKAAMVPYNTGYKELADAEQSWKAAQPLAKATTLKLLTQFFDTLGYARTHFGDAAEAFKQGDELQG